MNLINTFILWIWVLGLSLLIPTSLPAGGIQKTIIEQRENNNSSPLIALKEFSLLSAAYEKSPILITLKAGTPVQVLKVWDSPEGGKWLLVNILNDTLYQLFYKRGWVKIGT
tara:strand:+ start:54 stop:389 length:336 start_codon:yes stop_codon:yes gene_type:complete